MLPTQTVMDKSLDEWAVEEHAYDIGRAVEHVANDMEYAPCRAFKAIRWSTLSPKYARDVHILTIVLQRLHVFTLFISDCRKQVSLAIVNPSFLLPLYKKNKSTSAMQNRKKVLDI